MELDWLIFPSPDTSYSSDKSNGEIIFIPKRQEIKIEIENNSNSNNKDKQKNEENSNSNLGK